MLDALRNITLRSAMWVLLIGTIIGFVTGGFNSSTTYIGNLCSMFFAVVLCCHAITSNKIAGYAIAASCLGFFFVIMGVKGASTSGAEDTLLSVFWNQLTGATDSHVISDYLYSVMDGHWGILYLGDLCIIGAMAAAVYYGEARHKVIAGIALVIQVTHLILVFKVQGNCLDTEITPISNISGFLGVAYIIMAFILGKKEDMSRYQQPVEIPTENSSVRQVSANTSQSPNSTTPSSPIITQKVDDVPAKTPMDERSNIKPNQAGLSQKTKKLIQLKELLDAGILTEEEFSKEKGKILNS